MSFYFAAVSVRQFTCYNSEEDKETEHCASELPATMTDSMRMAIERRIILTSFRDSSTPVMRMLMTMLLMLMTLTTAARAA